MMQITRYLAVLTIIFSLCTGCAGANSAKQISKLDNRSGNAFAFKHADQSLALMNNDTIVWQFNYGKDVAKPYFHPVSLLDGTVLTVEAPDDHPWHHGLWFCWKAINGVNYWEEDRKTGKSKGTTDWTNVNIQKQDDHSAHITMDLSYHEPAKPVLLTEKRKVSLSAPDQYGGYTIDWISTFTAVADKVILERTPLPDEENGKPWGGYAGLSFRLRRGIEDQLYTDVQGPRKVTGTCRGKSDAVEYSGRLGDSTFGLAILDHTDNLNSPSPWYLTRSKNMDYFSPAVICYQAHTMSKGQTLTLKYRIVVHPNRWDANKLKEAQKLFIEGDK